jgi:hypothetical protein
VHRGFTSAGFRYRRELLRLLGIEAPKGRGGAVRAFASLVDRIGGERAGSRRPAGSERVRVYAFRLAPVASACLSRRYGAVVPVPVEAPGEVFARTPEDVLRARVPLRVLPEAAERVAAIEARASASDDVEERARLSTAIEAVKAAIPATGGDTPATPRTTDYLLSAARCTRDDAGRIYLKDAPLQTLPKAICDVIVPELPGDVFVSADIGSCHLAVAAARMGDGALAELAASGAAYERLAAKVIPGVPDGRAKAKGAVLALLNGAGHVRALGGRQLRELGGRTLGPALPPGAGMSATSATLLLLGAWLVLGGATAVALARNGQPAGTAVAALAAWPVLLPLLGTAPPTAGPFSARIHGAFSALRAALADPGAAGVIGPDELTTLEASLHRADARIGMVDRLLAEEALRADPLSAQLDRARGHAVDEVEAVLRGVVQLRVQVGLLALAGDTAPVRERLQELGARVRAIEEISLA